MTVQEKFRLWKTETLMQFNEKTELVANTETKQIMIKKLMPAHEFEVHQRLKEIRHKNLVKVYDCICDDEQCTVLEQYIAGITLEELCSQRVLSEEEVTDIMVQLCSGLNVLHEINIIHRDITPTNVMISDDGIIKIIDYDISRTEKSDVARDTHILGTEGFAAPEQFGFRQSGPQTDIYALGVLMNYMLLGTIPAEKCYHKGKLGRIIGKCTELNPENRYENVDELLSDLTGKKHRYLSLDKLVKGIPGVSAKNSIIKILSSLAYLAVIVFYVGLYGAYAKNTVSTLECIISTVFTFIIPLLFFSNYLNFQNKIMKNTSLTAKRIIFNFIAVISCIVGLFYFSILPQNFR